MGMLSEIGPSETSLVAGDVLTGTSGSLTTGVGVSGCTSGAITAGVSTGVSAGVITEGSAGVSAAGVIEGVIGAGSLTDSVGFISPVCDVVGSTFSTLSLGSEVFSIIS
jgi:hypothetical protein